MLMTSSKYLVHSSPNFSDSFHKSSRILDEQNEAATTTVASSSSPPPLLHLASNSEVNKSQNHLNNAVTAVVTVAVVEPSVKFRGEKSQNCIVVGLVTVEKSQNCIVVVVVIAVAVGAVAPCVQFRVKKITKLLILLVLLRLVFNS